MSNELENQSPAVAPGEAVDVVAWRVSHPDHKWKVYDLNPEHWATGVFKVQELMTVDQHERIVAALTRPEQPVPVVQDEREAFERAFVIEEGVYWSEAHQAYRSLNGRDIEATDAFDENLRLQGWLARAALSSPAQTEQPAPVVPEALPYWKPCNPGCDPEFNGSRSRHCAQLCHNAREALAAAPAQGQQDTGDSLSHALAQKCAEFVRLEAELAALKAQQAGQKPYLWVRVENGCIEDYTEDADLAAIWNSEDWPVTMALYTAPQPAPAQAEQRPVLLVRTNGGELWEQVDAESFEFCQQDSDYECRKFYTAPQPAQAPTEQELDLAGLGYPFSKEKAVELWHAGFRSEPITVLEAWEAIGHDIACNPSKSELLDSLRNMASICNAHGNDMPAPAQYVAQPAQQPDASGLVEALKFYAAGDHLLLADHDEWDTCSGEPINWLHDAAGTASVEDGSIAKEALSAYQAAPVDAAMCKWTRDEDTGAYDTQCGTTWHLADGDEPAEHGQYFCHHCGRPIHDAQQRTDDEGGV